MKSTLIGGILLIALGVISLLYAGITYTSHKEVVNVGPLHVTANEEKTIPLPPILGGLMLAGGVALVLASQKRSSRSGV